MENFNYYLSDGSKQDESENEAYITDPINILVTKNIITKYVNKTWKENNGCSKQYRRETYLYFLSIIYVGFNVIINRTVGARVHGKDVVYSLNVADKQYLKNKCFGFFIRKKNIQKTTRMITNQLQTVQQVLHWRLNKAT